MYNEQNNDLNNKEIQNNSELHRKLSTSSTNM